MILMNMFSSFDPSSMINPMFMLLLMIPIMMKSSWGKMSIIKKLSFKMMWKEVIPNLKSENQMSSTKTFISIFMVLSMINTAGLTPSSFSLTSHMSMNFPIAMTMWMMTNIFSMTKKNKMTISHMVPTGTPMMLSPLMTMIELVSNIIRPITLSVRLTANMVAGHILISLMENFAMSTKSNKLISLLISMTLITLELGVSIIQSYVFSILLTLYFSENH